MEDILNKLLAEEKALQFTHFNESTAFEIGSWLYKTAENQNLPIAINITLARRQLLS